MESCIIDQFKELWKELFNDSDEYINWYFKNIFKDNSYKYLKDESEVIGMLFENKYKIGVNDIELASKYIVGVGVVPHRRGEGVMNELLLNSIFDAKNNNCDILYLTPIDKHIYSKYGFSYVSTLSKYLIDFEVLKEFKKQSKLKKINKNSIDETLLKKLVAAYSFASSNYFSRVKREIKDFKNILSEVFLENGSVYLSENSSGEIDGYIFLLKNENIFVKELIFNSNESLSSLLSLIYGYKNYYKNVEILSSENSYLEDYFGSSSKTIKNKVQVRIIETNKFLQILSKRLKSDEQITISIVDNIIKENNSTFILTNKNVLKSDCKECDLKIDISNFTQLIFGFRDISSLLKRYPKLYISPEKIELFSKIFYKQTNYFNQDF